MAVVLPRTFPASTSPARPLQPSLEHPRNVSDALVAALVELGARFAFGLIGGAIVPFYEALQRAPLQVVNFRHECGASYAALEAALADDAPVIVYATTGPGLTNALTGMLAARWEGAKLLLISGYTGSERRGRYSLQETNSHTLGAELYRPGALFDHAVALEHAAELPRVLRTLARGFASPRGYVAHVALPLGVQATVAPPAAYTCAPTRLLPDDETMAMIHARLREPFAIWVGYGARHATARVRQLLDRSNAPILATPRAKGIVAEDDPRYLGVSGAVGGHEGLGARLRKTGVRRMLVLGSRLGEFSSAYDAGLMPPDGLIHVDLDPNVPGSAFPEVETLAVQAEIGQFLARLLTDYDIHARPLAIEAREQTQPLCPRPAGERVDPVYLMQCLQQRVVESSNSLIMAESGNAFAWTTRHLRMFEPHRYRQAGLFCPMGQISAGAIGAALASGRRTVAIVGDGALLMQNEISTAVQLGAEVTWIVLNDARYGMVHQGLHARGHAEPGMDIPAIDFAMLAQVLGAASARVDDEFTLLPALEQAMRARGPFVLDIAIDRNQRAPFGARIESIDRQAQSSHHESR